MIFNNYTKKIYFTLKITLIALYIFSIFKISNKAPKYLKYIDLIFNFTVGLLLIIIYNPFISTKITSFHKKVAFSAGIAILINNSIIRYLTHEIITHKILTH